MTLLYQWFGGNETLYLSIYIFKRIASHALCYGDLYTRLYSMPPSSLTIYAIA